MTDSYFRYVATLSRASCSARNSVKIWSMVLSGFAVAHRSLGSRLRLPGTIDILSGPNVTATHSFGSTLALLEGLFGSADQADSYEPDGATASSIPCDPGNDVATMFNIAFRRFAEPGAYLTCTVSSVPPSFFSACS